MKKLTRKQILQKELLIAYALDLNNIYPKDLKQDDLKTTRLVATITNNIAKIFAKIGELKNEQ
jgi:hypothetical protein